MPEEQSTYHSVVESAKSAQDDFNSLRKTVEAKDYICSVFDDLSFQLSITEKALATLTTNLNQLRSYELSFQYKHYLSMVIQIIHAACNRYHIDFQKWICYSLDSSPTSDLVLLYRRF